jgi:ribonuclease J
LKKVGKVDLLITEGTALNRNVLNYKKEKDLAKEVSKYMMKYDQVFIMQSSTNIDRTVSFVRSALKNKKNFILDLFTYSLSKIIDMNIKVDFKRIFVWKPLRYNKKDDSFKSNYMNFDTSSYFGKNYVMQVKVSMLSDIMKLYEKGLITNACFIYSMWDGYIEKEEKLRNFINDIEGLGIKVINLHTSGHSDINSMEKLNEIINSDKTIIIHTEDNSLGKDIFNNVIDLKDKEIIKI